MGKIGHCRECGQKFKKTMFGNRKGYNLINKGKRQARIECTGCGRIITVTPQDIQ